VDGYTRFSEPDDLLLFFGRSDLFAKNSVKAKSVRQFDQRLARITLIL
jgi:hypothetical protein